MLLALTLSLCAAADRVAVFAASATSPQTAARAEASLNESLTAAGVPIADGSTTFTAPPVDQRGAQLLAEANSAFDDLDTDAAERAARQALAAFTQRPESADAASLAHAWVLIGAVEQQRGKSARKRAEEAFARAALALPSYALDARRFGPDVKRAWDKAVRELDAKPKRQLTFSSIPAGATVEFRGQRLGVTPITQPVSVPPGSHFVRFSKPGYLPVGVFGEVHTDLDASATLVPAGALDAMRRAMTQVILRPEGDGPDDEVALDIARRLGGRYVVLAKVDGAGVGTFEVWDTATPNRLKNGALSTDTRFAATAVKRFVDGASAVPMAATEPRPQVSQAAEAPWLLQQWWFWTAAGVVVAGAATAGVVVATAPAAPAWNPVLDFP